MLKSLLCNHQNHLRPSGIGSSPNVQSFVRKQTSFHKIRIVQSLTVEWRERGCFGNPLTAQGILNSSLPKVSLSIIKFGFVFFFVLVFLFLSVFDYIFHLVLHVYQLRKNLLLFFIQVVILHKGMAEEVWWSS